MSDVTRRLIRVGVDTYEPEDKRPAVPNTRKLAALAGVNKSRTVADLVDDLKRVAGDQLVTPEQDAMLQIVLTKLGQRSSLVGEARTAEVPAPVVAERPPTPQELTAAYEQHALETQGDWAAPRRPPPMTDEQLAERVRSQRQKPPPFGPETDAMRVRRRTR